MATDSVATDSVATGGGDPGLRVAVVGPTHPYKGGVAAHTTELAHRLAAAGHDTVLVSWSRLYPAALYPGEQAVPDGAPDLPPYPRTVRMLRWDRPGTWWRAGARLRDVDLVVLAVVVPVQVPALRVLLRALRAGAARPRVVVVAHNVVPHEPHPGDAWLMGRLLATADAVLVHSAQLADQAVAIGARQVCVADLPPHLPGGVAEPGPGPGPAPGPLRGQADGTHRGERRTRVLALGMVREYKGFDLLLEAAAQVSDVEVTVAGEQWGRAGERLRALAQDPRLAGRVRLEAGYVPGERVAVLAATHDVLALPYRHATASQNVALAHAHRLPVVASATGTFPAQVRDGVDGLVVPPGDVVALAAALREVAVPARLAQLRGGVPAVDLDGPWRRYLRALVADLGPRAGERA
ncbi:MAG TPA: glycosyltransferase [Kineosporiaceae bacterium]